MNNKMKKCDTCQKEIAKNAKECPECGAKQKKPIYKKWWFWCIIVVAVISISSGGGDEDTSSTNSENSSVVSEQNNSSDTKEEIVYEEITVNDLMDVLEENALSASNTFKGKHLQITGKLAVIDSNGKYFSIFPDEQFAITGVQCYMKNDEQKNHIATLSKDQTITVKVKITNVGEVLGYSADLIEFVE